MEQREESRARSSFPESRQRSTIGQRLGEGGCFFYFFSLRQRKGEIPFGPFRKGHAGMPLQGQQQPQPLLVPKKGLQPLPNPRQSLARAKTEKRRYRRFSAMF